MLQCDSVSDGADLSLLQWSTAVGLCQIQKLESDPLYVSPELSPQGL